MRISIIPLLNVTSLLVTVIIGIFSWKQKYEILYERILPFEKQLEAYEAEKQALLGISQNAQLEVEKLNRDYAKLFGHQNHKQKIHYVEKIKMENSSLKTVSKFEIKLCLVWG